jgi:hypothetical protein
MRLGLQALLQCGNDARLADPGFAGNQYDLAVPDLARAQRRNSSSISSSRPISGLSAAPRNASNRLATTLSPSTCQLRIGAVPSAAAMAPSSRQSNRSPIRRRVVESIITASGGAVT